MASEEVEQEIVTDEDVNALRQLEGWVRTVQKVGRVIRAAQSSRGLVDASQKELERVEAAIGQAQARAAEADRDLAHTQAQAHEALERVREGLEEAQRAGETETARLRLEAQQRADQLAAAVTAREQEATQRERVREEAHRRAVAEREGELGKLRAEESRLRATIANLEEDLRNLRRRVEAL
jgi:chromosome segregation ATPase